MEKGHTDGQSSSSFEVSGAPLTVPEVLERLHICTPDRTYNRSGSLRLATFSQQSNVGKGSRQVRSVTLGKGLALKVGDEDLRSFVLT